MTGPVRVSIIGVGTTRHVLHYPGLTWLEMLGLAVKDALEDAGGIDPAEIEAGVVAYHGEVMTEMGDIGPEVSAGIGAAPAGFTQVCAACSGGAVALQHGWTAVASQLARLVLVCGFEKGGDMFDVSNYIDAIDLSSDPEYDFAFGFTHIDNLVLIMNRYATQFDVSMDAVGQWVEQCHWYAKRNPKAFHFKTPMVRRNTAKRALLKLIAQRVEGASAVILAPEGDSRYAAKMPVYLDGIAYACGTGNLSCYFNGAHKRYDIAESRYTGIAAQKAYRMAGIVPDDIDLVQVSDATAVIGMMQLEGLGLCGIGEAGAAVLDGATAVDGRFPTNTYGGSIGCGHASGASALTAVIECVTQLRGDAGQRQVWNPKVAVAQSSSGANSGNTVVVLRKG
ncbi:MAG: thiolase family protein [Desulfobacterales bacterium]|nr:MAG: thiolase family protein [Desulfobacterales bacterium]